jgi:hypothetical protein
VLLLMTSLEFWTGCFMTFSTFSCQRFESTKQQHSHFGKVRTGVLAVPIHGSDDAMMYLFRSHLFQMAGLFFNVRVRLNAS